jgi:hypothetical protein
MTSKMAARVVAQADWSYVTEVVGQFTAPAKVGAGRSAKHATGELHAYREGITVGQIVTAVVPNGDEDTIDRLAQRIALAF